MSYSWDGDDLMEFPPISPLGWVRLFLRLAVLGPTLVVLTFLMSGIRLIEAPLVGLRRPVSSYFPMIFSRLFFIVTGIRHIRRGERMKQEGAVVANHCSWLDILALNARKRIFFVSKAEVASWPGIGLLSKAAGTVFIKRERTEAKAQIRLFEERLHAGHKLLFFPEGTSSDSRRILPFRSTLFAAFYAPELASFMYVQPVTLNYHAPQGADPRFYGWWGEMSFGASFLSVLAAPSGGAVELIYHAPLKVSDVPSRKELAARCEEAVRSGLTAT